MSVRDKELAKLTREDYEKRKELLEKYDDVLFGMEGDTSLVDNAVEQAGQIVDRGAEQADRNLSRFGVAKTGAQAKAAERALGLGAATTGTNVINNARIAQEEINQGVLGNLVAMGRREQQGAFQGLGSVANMEAARIQQGQNAALARQQQRNQMLGTVATFAGFAIGM